MEEEELKVLPSVPALTHSHIHTHTDAQMRGTTHTMHLCCVVLVSCLAFSPFHPRFTLRYNRREIIIISASFFRTHTHIDAFAYTLLVLVLVVVFLFFFRVFSLRSVRLNFCLFRWYFENDHNTQLFSYSLCFDCCFFFFSSPRRLYRCCCFFLRSVMFWFALVNCCCCCCFVLFILRRAREYF